MPAAAAFWAPRAEADIFFLLARIKPTSVAALEAIYERFFPAVNVHADTLELLEKYLEDKNE